MRQAGVSKLKSIEPGNSYKDKKGDLWYTFQCFFEDDTILSTRREQNTIELVVGDNVHYVVLMRTSVGFIGTTRKVADNIVMRDEVDVETTVSEIKSIADSNRDLLQDIHYYTSSLRESNTDLTTRLEKIEKALKYIASEVN